MSKEQKENECGGCYYFGFKGLLLWCRHPDINDQVIKHTNNCNKWSDGYNKEEKDPKRLPLFTLKDILRN